MVNSQGMKLLISASATEIKNETGTFSFACLILIIL